MLSVLRPRWLLLALVLGAATVFGLQHRGETEAHALLVRADPPINAQLREAPAELTLYFSESLEQKFSDARVESQTGDRVDDHIEFDASDPAAMHIFLKPLQPGYLNIQWSTVSAVDGHAVSGSYPLTILNADGSQPAGTPIEAGASVAGEQPDALRVITKWVLLIAASLVVGALGFLAYVTPALPGEEGESARHAFERRVLLLAGIAVVVLAIAGLVELAVQSHDIHQSISAVLGTRWGGRWLLRNLILIQPILLVGALLAGFSNRRLVATFALIGAASYLAVTSSVSHSAAGGGSFWAAGSDFLHLLAASVWIGMLGLLVLLFLWGRKQLAPGQRYPVLATALQRFSTLAVVSVALLLFTGTVNSIIEVGHLSDMLQTGYGRALTLKLLLILPLLGIAVSNAYLSRPDLVEAVENTSVRNRSKLLEELEGQLNHRIRLEFLAGIAVLAVVALLVQLTPTRGRLSTPDQAGGESVQTAETADIQATLVVNPNELGDNTFEVYLAGNAQNVQNVRLEFTKHGNTAGESRLDLDPSNPPTFYVGKGPFLNEAGNWDIVLNLQVISGPIDLRLPFKVDVSAGPGAVAASRAGGSFASPLSLSTSAAVLLAVSGLASLFILLGSIPRPGLTQGYMGWLTEEAAYRLAPLNVRPVWTLTIMVVTGIALGLLVGGHLHKPLSQAAATQGNPVAATAESIARGKMLFSQNCTMCHGDSGRGDGPEAASLPIPPANLYEHVPYHPDQFFFGVMTKGLGGVMPSFEGTISETDRWNILNYLRATFTATPADR